MINCAQTTLILKHARDAKLRRLAKMQKRNRKEDQNTLHEKEAQPQRLKNPNIT